MQAHQPPACASVRCVTKVTVRIITHEQLVEYLIKQPMAKHQISVPELLDAPSALSACELRKSVGLSWPMFSALSASVKCMECFSESTVQSR
eukprot:1157492-Pelagomonas_calceolata.AAC.10